VTLSLFLNPQIRAYAKANGLVFTADEIERINTDVSGIATTDESGLRFNLAGGSVQTIDAAIGAMAVGLGKSAPEPKPETLKSTIPAGANPTERALALNAANRGGRGAARAVEAQQLVDEFGSPWDARSINRTSAQTPTNAPRASPLTGCHRLEIPTAFCPFCRRHSTRQAMITNLDPALATRLRRQAGLR